MIFQNSQGLKVEVLFMSCLICEYREIISREIKEVSIDKFEAEFEILYF